MTSVGDSVLNVRSIEEGDKSKLSNLIHFETRIHRHLDWQSPIDWIGRQPYLIIERNGELLAAIACPPDPPEMAWIRLFVVSSHLNARDAWNLLWEEVQGKLCESDSMMVAAIPIRKWFETLLKESDFIHTQDVIMLSREKDFTLPEVATTHVEVRSMKIDDLQSVHDLDEIAFGYEWHNSLESLEMAFHQSSLSTVAILDDELVGYQISTSSPIGAHLARLAVRQDLQGKGIGYALSHDLITTYHQRGISHVTVNTQKDNIQSLKLYEKVGFKQTGEEFPVYFYKLVES
jgi:ribosomal protein S18 acetylase RimI-like enzyme